MQNSKLTGILQSLTKIELKDFNLYLHSDLFNSNQEVRALYECLKNTFPHFDEEQVTKEKIFKKLYPKQKYNDQKIRYLFTDLTKHLENYLAYIAFTKEGSLQANLLGKELSIRNCDKAYSHILNKIRDASTAVKDADFYYHQ